MKPLLVAGMEWPAVILAALVIVACFKLISDWENREKDR